MKLYDLVKELLEKRSDMRDSDKRLMWAVWYKLGYADASRMDREALFTKSCPTPESITRCRRKIQERYPHLQAGADVKAAREEKAKEKGTHIYREPAEKQWKFTADGRAYQE